MAEIASASVARPLPRMLSPVVGRELEIAAAAALLRQADVRLLTLTGPAGVGKTTLALQVAAELTADFPEGVYFVPLATIGDPAFVLAAVAQGLGLRPSDDDLALRQYLGSRRLLLVLDNFEQILAAAPSLTGLLVACPRVAALVTSRARLRVAGERVFPLLPLAVPPPIPLPAERLREYEAVRLFLDRGRAMNPDFDLTPENAGAVADLCRRLDGLPLALELAAGWLRLFSPEALLARLERRLPLLTGGPQDQPARLQTMRDAIAWSYDLLSPGEQALFRRLAVFAGGFTTESAEYIVRSAGSPDSPTQHSALDLLASLVDKSLVRPEAAASGVPRFGMLETIREFGLEELDVSAEGDAVRDVHAEYFVELMGRAEPAIFEQDRRWLERLDAEHANIRAALAWTIHRQPVSGLRLACAFAALIWRGAGYLGEAREWLEQALSACRCEAVPPPVRAKALYWLGVLAVLQPDLDVAEARLHEALELQRASDDRAGLARTLAALGGAAEYRGDDTRATAFYTDALALFRALGDRAWAAMALENLADAAYRRGELDQAAALLADALAEGRAAGNAIRTAMALVGGAQLAAERGDYAEALARLREGLDLARQADFREAIADALVGFARVAAEVGQAATAARLLGASEAILRPAGAVPAPHHAQHRRAVAAARRTLDDATFSAAWAAGRMLPAPAAIAEALAVSAPPACPDTVPMSAAPADAGLTPREVEVLGLLAAGLSNQAIADALFIGRGTVKSHVTSILGKLGLPSRAVAVAYAHRHGLAPVEPPTGRD